MDETFTPDLSAEEKERFIAAIKRGDVDQLTQITLDWLIATKQLDLPPEGSNRHLRRTYAKKRQTVISQARVNLRKHFAGMIKAAA